MKRKKRNLARLGLVQIVVALAAGRINGTPAFAVEQAAPLTALGRMPVKEITVFKDGHAFVEQEGNLPTAAAGDVLMDYLPTPVIGTFWAYATDKSARLTGVVAGQRRVSVEHTALTIPELLTANVGAEAIITEINSNRYPASGPGRESTR